MTNSVDIVMGVRIYPWGDYVVETEKEIYEGRITGSETTGFLFWKSTSIIMANTKVSQKNSQAMPRRIGIETVSMDEIKKVYGNSTRKSLPDSSA